MPRLARLDAPGVLHHVIIRGIERRRIFRDNTDRDSFVERLAKLLPETQTACYAWALIPNHVHFLLRTGDTPLATLMRRLLTGYAVSFNRRHRRHGQLFQNRYKSILCQEDLYLRELVRYIHLNPVRAGIVSDLTELNGYPYSGHSVLVGRQGRQWQDVDYVLRYFGKTRGGAIGAYLSYVEVGLHQGRREELIGGGLIRSLGGWLEVKKHRLKTGSHVMSDERILGDSDFVDSVLAHAGERYERQYELKHRGYDLNWVLKRVAEVYSMEEHEVFSKGRQKAKVNARSLFCYWAVRELGISLTEMGRRFGMSVPGVGYAVQRGETIAQKNNYQMIG